MRTRPRSTDRSSHRPRSTPWSPATGAGNHELTGIDVETLSDKATRSGDETCRQVFREFGAELGRALLPVVSELKPEGLVFGGQIAKSFALLAETLREQLKGLSGLRAVVQASFADSSALCGAAKTVFDLLPDAH